MEREKNNKKLMWSILLVAVILVVGSSTYAFFASSVRDERTNNNNGGNKMKTCEIADATIIENIPDSVGNIEATSMLPGHKEIAGFSVTAKGDANTSSSFQILYDIEENTFSEGDIKVSVYKRETPLEITTNYFACEQTMTSENGIQFYEKCEEKEIGSLVQETILTNGTSITIGKDTIVVKDIGRTRYYYVVLEFLNKESEQNSSMNAKLRGNIRVENIGEKTKYKEDILNGMDPVIKDELVPVTIDSDGTVHKADESDDWYSYEKKEWANAVILKNSETYCSGEIIPEDNIESYFVWIPKYRYQLWNLEEYTELMGLCFL